MRVVRAPLLIFVSDIHLTDSLRGASVSRAATFERFWTRIEGARRDRPAWLVFCGDLFDIVRSPTWLEGPARPYDTPSVETAAKVEQIVDGILAREADFFAAIRRHVEAGALEVRYLLGNHDRLLSSSPAARRKVWRAFTGRDEDVEFLTEAAYGDHGVLAYHGHLADVICHEPDGGAPIGDAIGLELIVRFPRLIRQEVGLDTEHLDDVDDVRPIYAVPAWVRQLATDHHEYLKPIGALWSDLVDDFLGNQYVKAWMGERRKLFGFDPGKKLKLLLEMSRGRVVARGHDRRLTDLYRLFNHAYDGRMARNGAARLREETGLNFVVNGHSHFPSHVPLGRIGGEPSVYFNTGTWRTVHQIAHELTGRPTFVAYDAMSYLVFFPPDDALGRRYEWWTGAMVPR